MTDTSFETPLVANSSLSSGVNARCQTRWPTRRYFKTALVSPSMTATRLAGPSATKPSLPSEVNLIPTGWISSLRNPGTSKPIVWVTAFLTGSMTETLPPTSDDTQSSDPSGVNSAKRGRGGTRMLATIFFAGQSMRWAMLVVSEVFTTIAPSGLTATPSGSTPTGNWTIALRVLTSMAVSSASFSLATNTNVPSGLTRSCSGSGPDGSSPTTAIVLVSMTWIVSSSPRQTKSSESSFDNAIPRGRWPTLTVLFTCSVAVSITEIELPFSLLTKAVLARPGAGQSAEAARAKRQRVNRACIWSPADRSPAYRVPRPGAGNPPGARPRPCSARRSRGSAGEAAGSTGAASAPPP